MGKGIYMRLYMRIYLRFNCLKNLTNDQVRIILAYRGFRTVNILFSKYVSTKKKIVSEIIIRFF